MGTCCVVLGRLFNISDPVTQRPTEGVFIILSLSCFFLLGQKSLSGECFHSLGLSPEERGRGPLGRWERLGGRRGEVSRPRSSHG